MSLLSYMARLARRDEKWIYAIAVASIAAAAIIGSHGRHALALNAVGRSAQAKQNYSAIGTVSDVSASSMSATLADAVTSDGASGVDLAFDLSKADNIEDSGYSQLSLSDIKIGDKAIVQGFKTGDTVSIYRLIDLSWNAPAVIATTTATSTSAATSTDTAASSTDLTEASTTPDMASTTDVIETASSSPDTEASATAMTASSTDDDASSTLITASSTDSIASSTDSTASTTPFISVPVGQAASSSPETASSATGDASSTEGEGSGSASTTSP